MQGTSPRAFQPIANVPSTNQKSAKNFLKFRSVGKLNRLGDSPSHQQVDILRKHMYDIYLLPAFVWSKTESTVCSTSAS